MSKLYKELAAVYNAMYATFIDYQEEFVYYHKILADYGKNNILEIGSGTGNLASHFHSNGYQYLGLDMSVDMLEIARSKHPACLFMEGDMRGFVLEAAVDAVLITGRSISYLLENSDVNSTFSAVHHNLHEGGIFCFDFIDASRFIPDILRGEKIVHHAKVGSQSYCRESRWRPNLKYGMDLIWDSTYTREVEGHQEEIGADTAVVRTFTREEIEIFLHINGFTVLDIKDRVNYAFPTYLVIAKT